MRHATFKQLRAFTAILKHGSVTSAAQALSVTPPAITLQMRLLTDLVGLPLVERTPEGMKPTEPGLALLASVERIEAELADVTATLASLAGGSHGKVRVGIVSTAKYFAPRALAAFARAHAGIELLLTIGNRAEILEGLRHYALDVAITGRPPQEFAVTASVIGDHPHLIVAPPGHPLAGRRAVKASRLAGETFLVREPGSGTRALMERFFEDMAIQPRIGMQIASNETIKQAVIAGLGIALISGHTVEAELVDGRLVTLDIEGLPIIRQWHVVHLRERRIVPATQTLWCFLTDDAGAYLPKLAMRVAVGG